MDAFFRDAKWDADGVEHGIHEYSLSGAVDRTTSCLVELRATPHVLPFGTCPFAADNVDLVLGVPVGDLGSRTTRMIRGTDGCTHLTDAVRSLVAVVALVRELSERDGMTMILATHEMSFAREVASKICFLDDGVIREQGRPEQLLTSPSEPRTQQFLQRIIAAGRL